MIKDTEKKYDNLLGDLNKLKNSDFAHVERMLKGDSQLDTLKKGIGSYDLKKDVSPYTKSDEKAELHLSTAKGYIRRGEGILSKNTDLGSSTYGMALKELQYAEEELENHKDPKDVKKAKEEIANFAEALARKIKIDIEKKDSEYSLKKDLKEEDKKDLATYEKCRAKALKVAEDAVEYAKKLIKD
ncbi:MAG: hypothetical protein Q8O03_03920 [Nanoarchaeota archaeon]|nr:hypothetical protein [Nanoarchaeota archaeon]